jgi:hypothetical protein
MRKYPTLSTTFLKGLLMSWSCLGFIGAGEGIRTLDPNLGKVPVSSSKPLFFMTLLA